MTKFKVCSKIHLFIIISTVLICIGIAIGTIGHFVTAVDGFFNYGGEFASYNSITVTYPAEVGEDKVREACDELIVGVKPTNVSYGESYGDNSVKKEAVYKFSANSDIAKLKEIADNIESKLNENISSDAFIKCTAYAMQAEVEEGGSKAITFASIALASAAAFMFIYYVIRYKLRAACSALLACVHNLGVFVALLAITRIPVATDTIAIAAAVIVLTMIFCGILFDRTRKNFANEKYAKTDRIEVIDTSAIECRKTTLIAVCALAAAAVIVSVFTTIAASFIGAFAPGIVALLGVIVCGYGAMFFTPAVHSAIDGLFEKVIADRKKKKPAKKGAKPEEAEKAEEAK